MVKGLNTFRNYFSDYTDQYVLIGGVACDISFGYNNTDFRATRDIDMVLIAEAQTKEFGQKFWDFIRHGRYRNRAKSNGQPQFYRFDKPESPEFPAMIELFSRVDGMLTPNTSLVPLHIDNTVSSLSAILLNDAYYKLLLDGRTIINGISVLKPAWLIPFKAKAWLDLTQRAAQGEHIDSRDIKKHKNDIIRITSELILESCHLTQTVKNDMCEFVDKLHIADHELKNLNIRGIHEDDIKKALQRTYHLP